MALSAMEINPEMMNKLMQNVGVLPTFKFVDMLCFEKDYISSFPHEVYALLLLFPLTPQHEEFRKKQDDEQKDKEPDAKVYFMKQTMDNSCGIVGLIHATASNKGKMSFDQDSALKDFLDKTADVSPDERAKLLEKNEPNEDDVHFHFIAFTAVDGHLYEFDGLTSKPIDHGPTEGTLLEDASKICKKFTERESGEVRFLSVALIKA